MARVFLAGAGPGSPDLLTVKTARLLAVADIVLHDSLVGPEILALINPKAQVVDVGKRCGRESTAQAKICALLVESARTDLMVVRLKGGDPTIFGRLAEETQALHQAGIEFEVVPGITAASAAAAAAGLSLTKRQVARSVHFITGHGADHGLPMHDWHAMVRAGGTMAIYMGSRHFVALVDKLLQAGVPKTMPALIVESASLPQQRVIPLTLAEVPAVLAEAPSNGPVLILLGFCLFEGEFILSK